MEKVELFETDISTIKEYQKSQAVRLWDIFFIAMRGHSLSAYIDPARILL